MAAHHSTSRIRLAPLPGLAEVKDRDDIWTGITDATARRKRQTRLNVRAYRRRKAEALKAQSQSSLDSATPTDPELEIPCWVEDEQAVTLLPASQVRSFTTGTRSLLPSETLSEQWAAGIKFEAKIIFPLSSDHLIVLLQYNVLRACITNRQILSGVVSSSPAQCSSNDLHVLPYLSDPQSLPLSLQPSEVQRTVPHEPWVDIIPHSTWRDNLVLATGTYDEDELWEDCIGGLFEGFPHSEITQRGVIAWSPPWDHSGWELSQGFLDKWSWSMKGCEDMVDVTNSWRRQRGEDPLVLKEAMGSERV